MTDKKNAPYAPSAANYGAITYSYNMGGESQAINGHGDLAVGFAHHLAGNLSAATDYYSHLQPGFTSSYLQTLVAAEQGNTAAFNPAIAQLLSHHPPHLTNQTLLPQQLIETYQQTPKEARRHIHLAHNQVATACKAQTRLDLALILFHAAEQLEPDDADSHYWLGDSYHDAREFDTARQYLEKALTLDPDHVDAHYTLGVLYQDLGQLDGAIKHHEIARQLRPDHVKTYNNLGSAYHHTGNFEKARACFTKALELESSFFPAADNLGVTYNMLGETKRAIEAFELAARTGNQPGSYIKSALALPPIPASVDEIHFYRERLRKTLRQLSEQNIQLTDPVREVGATCSYLAYHGLGNRELNEEIAQFYIKACPSLTEPVQAQNSASNINVTSKIRIGIISSFFKDHTISRYFTGIIQHLSRDDFHVTVLTPYPSNDEFATRIRNAADEYITLTPLLDIARQEVVDLRLDILLYADIGQDPFTYFLAFSRLAPIQCVYYGHPDTTGIPNIDYFISHEDAEPDNAQENYSETLVCLSSNVAYAYYEKPQLPTQWKQRSDFGFPENQNLYLCTQSLFKIHPDFDQIVGDILRKDPKGIIAFFAGQQDAWTRQFETRLKKSIPDIFDRIIFLPRLSHPDFLSLMKSADVILDTPGFSGGATTLEGLATGTPIVTLPGTHMRGRQTYACYKFTGIDLCNAPDYKTYSSTAIDLANDNDLQHQARELIRMNSGRLFYDMGHVTELGALLRGLQPTKGPIFMADKI